MAQKLILPINKLRITAGYKNANYRKEYGYTHYGCDFTDQARADKKVWGSGKGSVSLAGWSNSGGNGVIVGYPACLLTDGTGRSLVIRYYHLDSIKV